MKLRHLLLSVLLSTPAFAAGGAGADQAALPGAQVQVALSLYAGGISFGKMDLDTTLRGTEYRSVANFQTSGMVNAFWQSEIQATSTGKIGPKILQPGLYDSFDINRTGRKQEVSLTYENGLPRLYADPVYSTNGYEVKEDDQKNTLDPLSALTFIVSGVAADAGNPCSLTAPVFDGRRRYNIEMTKVKDTDIKMDNGLYAGKASLCQIKYRALAGMRPNVMKANQSFPAINAWVVNYSGAAGHAFAVPVKVWADTKYGQLSVVAESVKIDGQVPKS
ncbi:MAG TPA: DUF3108 domain-containing protein [Rhizomicrobium sp.]|jgi:hypothetical protein|nr:DUF3108 domain-containing protein [Rhizomicrobium sp.]